MKPIDLEMLGLHESWIEHRVVLFSDTFGRKIRQDPITQLGVPTQYLAMLALQRRDVESAADLARYMRQESDFIFDSMMTLWLQELLDYARTNIGLNKFDTLLRVPKSHIWASFQKVGNDFVDDALEALGQGDSGGFDMGLSHARRVYKTMGDEVVKFVQDILTEVANFEGEDGPIEALRAPYDHIWRKRYEKWESLTGEERLQLSCEGMRAHFGGPSRQGEFRVVDEVLRYRMTFSGCGTGGVLRRGDLETGEGPYATTGVISESKAYSWGKVDIPWYCVHCNLYLEHWPAQDVGINRRPVIYVDDPSSPITTEWLVYKDLADTSEDDYRRIGLTRPVRKGRA